MLAPNTILHNYYLVIGPIGRGAQGTVYQAKDIRFNRVVALKESAYSRDTALRETLEREGRLLGSMRKHPSLPIVFDYFTEGDNQFLVMEFLPGQNLAEILQHRAKAFPMDKVLDWADKLLDALELLHTSKPPIIHRDIKPQNLKLDGEGNIVLLDFGLAKDTDAGSQIHGYTLPYAPLEQRQEISTDARSDLYSLAATLYHLMTAVKPPDALTRFTDVANGRPDPLRPANLINTEITAAVSDLILKTLSLEREQRPATASELRKLFKSTAHHRLLAEEIETTIIKGKPFTIPVNKKTVKYGILGRCEGQVLSVAYSPDNSSVATGSDDRTVRVWDVYTGEMRILGRGDGSILCVAYSPDGKSVASGGKEACIWDIESGQKQELKLRDVFSLSFSPDGRWLILGAGNSQEEFGILFLWDLHTKEVTRLGRIDRWVRAVSFAPSGKTVASTSWDPNNTICLWNIQTGQMRTLGKCADKVDSIAFSPDGESLASGGEIIRIWSVRTGKVRILRGGENRIGAIAYSPDGNYIVSSGKVIRLWDLRIGKVQIIGQCEDYTNSIAFAPRGMTLVSGSNDRSVRIWRL